MPHTPAPLLSRRNALRTLAQVGVLTVTLPGGQAWAQSLPLSLPQGLPLRGAPAVEAGRVVVVFLRGAYDGLSAFVPYGDPNYYRLRDSIAIAPPEKANAAGDNAVLALDTLFGLHPALAPMLPLWQQGVLAFVPAAGSPDATRSHFEAQHHWEVGIPGRNSASTGLLNGLAQALAPANAREQVNAIGVGEANPAILLGAAPVRLIPSGQAATRTGVLANDRTRAALMDLYAGNDTLSQQFRQGAQSRMQSAEQLAMDRRTDNNAGDNGAGAATGLLLNAQHLGTLMQADPRLRLGFLSAGGWDTHANQGNATGALARNFSALAEALVQLRKDFSQPGDVVVVVSEFGRTAAENGTRGTDHGHGNAMWLIGDRIAGGRWHGPWAGLERSALNENRDLPVLADFRAVLAPVLRSSLGLTTAQLAPLFPGFALEQSLKGLVRT